MQPTRRSGNPAVECDASERPEGSVRAGAADPLSFIRDFFGQRHENADRGTLSISGERYILVRAASMSVEFFDLVLSLYRDRSAVEAWSVANNLLYDIAHAIGRADARCFRDRLRDADAEGRLAAGPAHAARCGWSAARVHPESDPTPGPGFLLLFDLVNSFEADAWMRHQRRPAAPVCIMNAGYASGWGEESLGFPLVAVEVECRARGDPRCRFIMAPPARIEDRLAAIREQSGAERIPARSAVNQAVPEFFHRRKLEDQIRASHEELERRVWERTAELAAANRALEMTIEERRRMEDRLLRMGKMESIGRVAGGVAHDFNNLLTAIFGFVEVARVNAEAGRPVLDELRGIRQAAERAADLTRQLLAFARRQPLRQRRIDINALLRESGEMLRLLAGEKSRVALNLLPDLWLVQADPGQVQRAVVNLVVNARDAMPAGGTITIGTHNTTVTKEQAARNPDIQAGEFVTISVADTGPGMTPEVLARIFEPFFTTKGAGEGTGLGLAICHGIANQHGGCIVATSQPGEGTRFELSLPRAEGSTPDPAPHPEPDPGTPGHETILLVEDEVLVRELAQQVLEAQGYEVLAASNGEAALERLRKQAARIDLLIADVVMPRMSGIELATRLRATLPELRILLISGYSEATTDPGAMRGAVFLAKPFTPDNLLAKVRQALTAPPLKD